MPLLRSLISFGPFGPMLDHHDMHATAIFVGVLIFGWGFTDLQVMRMFLTAFDDGPWELIPDRRAPRIFAAFMSIAPIGMCVAGARWFQRYVADPFDARSKTGTAPDAF